MRILVLLVLKTSDNLGLGLMMASTLENNGAKVYILGRRSDVLAKAAKDFAVILANCACFK